MSTEIYSIPSVNSPIACFDFERNALNRANANATVWGIPLAELTAITPLQSIFEQRYLVSSNISTACPAATADRNGAWADLLIPLENLYNKYIINNEALSEADKKAMHIHDQGGRNVSPYAAPVTSPIVTLVSEESSTLHVIYSDPSAPNTHYKPAGVAFCELAYEVGKVPATAGECSECYYAARSHVGIIFPSDQRGKTMYAFARWVNNNGKFGPWSSLITGAIS
jgi:hypothetical protein